MRRTLPMLLALLAATPSAQPATPLTTHQLTLEQIKPDPDWIGAPVEHVQANRIQVAADVAAMHRVYVVLKGHRTIVATPDGKVFINPTGNAGMATGGTGDVLTGVIAAWLAQLLDAEAACRLGVFLHGTAGDLAESRDGQVPMMATDVLDLLGSALKYVTTGERSEVSS